MHPESSADRAFLLEDFGELVTVSPAAGGPARELRAIFSRGARRASELELDQGVGAVELMGSDPWLLLTAEDASEIERSDRVSIPSQLPQMFRVHTVEHVDEDAAFRDVRLLEG